MANDFTGDSDFVSLYNFESNTNDSIGGNNLTAIIGVMQYVVGAVPKQGLWCLEQRWGAFDNCSITNANLDAGHPLKNGVSTAFTAGFWHWVGGSGVDYMFNKGWASDADACLILYQNSGKLSAINGRGGSWEYAAETNALNTGQWYWIGFQYDPATRGWRWYVWDGVTDILFQDLTGTFTNPMNIGTSPCYYFNGEYGNARARSYYDEWFWCKRLLTADEMQLIIAGEFPGGDPPGPNDPRVPVYPTKYSKNYKLPLLSSGSF